MGAIEQDIVAEALRVTDGALAADIKLRVVGGVAVGLHTPEGVHPALVRPYRDIDLVTPRLLRSRARTARRRVRRNLQHVSRAADRGSPRPGRAHGAARRAAADQAPDRAAEREGPAGHLGDSVRA